MLVNRPSKAFDASLVDIEDVVMRALACEYLDESWHLLGDEALDNLGCESWLHFVTDLVASVQHDDPTLSLVGEDFALYVRNA